MTQRRYLQFANHVTGERYHNRFDVTDKSERQIERLEMGMLMRCDVVGGWYVDDFTETAEQSSNLQTS